MVECWSDSCAFFEHTPFHVRRPGRLSRHDRNMTLSAKVVRECAEPSVTKEYCPSGLRQRFQSLQPSQQCPLHPRALPLRSALPASASSRSKELTNARKAGNSPLAIARKPRLSFRHIRRQSSSNVNSRVLLGRIVAAKLSRRLWSCEALMPSPFRIYPFLAPLSSAAGSLVRSHGCFQGGYPRFDVFDLDGLGSVVENGVCHPCADGRRRILIDQQL
jgi:hypothetical protein